MDRRGTDPGSRGRQERRRGRATPVARVRAAAFALGRSRHTSPANQRAIQPRVAVLATLLVGAALVAGSLAATSRSSAGATASPIGSAAAPGVPEPSVPGYSLVVPARAVHPIPDAPGALPARDVVAGGAVYQLASSTASGEIVLRRIDPLSGESVVLARIPAGHQAVDLAATSTGLTWLETWSAAGPAPGDVGAGPLAAGPVAPVGAPLRWRVMTLAFADGTSRAVASGVNTRIAIQGAGASVNPPLIAADGQRLVYTLEATDSGEPLATRIIVRDLATGTTVRQFDVGSYVSRIGLSGDAVFWITVPSAGTAGADPNDGTLLLAPSDASTSRVVDTHVKDASIGGGMLAWARETAQDASIEVMPVTGGSLRRVPGPPVRVGSRQPGPSFGLSATAGWVAWLVLSPRADGSVATELVLWREGAPLGQVVAGLRQPDFVTLSDGWAVWREGDASGTIDTHAVRLADLGAAPPGTPLRQL